MQFKHPEFLWALLLLLIPILIHLFQLRKFKKTSFTNVAFLKTIKQNTRKSSQLKKWLILLTRIGLIAFLVLAFAQPFLPNTDNYNKSNDIVIYLDNSFSMQSKGVNGTLLNQAKQSLLNYLPNEGSFTLFTNDKTFKNTSKQNIQRDLIGIGFSNNQLSYDAAYLKGLQYFKATDENLNNLIMISDFQNTNESWKPQENPNINLGLIQLKPQSTNNISIDSVYFKKQSTNNNELVVKLSNYGDPIENVSVSLLNSSKLVSKAATDLTTNGSVEFTISNENDFEGLLTIDDNSLEYDNQFYFSINKLEKINVLSINDSDDGYLKKIFTEDEFVYTGFRANTIEYNQLEDQNLIILNHLEIIPQALINALNSFKNNGGSVLIIPAKNASVESYNALMGVLNQPLFSTLIETPKQVTSIVFSHPLIASAFYAKVTNFQYPELKTYYSRSTKANSIYNYEDGSPFLLGDKGIYSFSSAIEEENGNFKNSPLIVPVIYNMAKQSIKLPRLHYNIGEAHSISLKTTLENDRVIQLIRDDYNNIPLQRSYGKYVEVTTGNEPTDAGHYSLIYNGETLQNLSFNYPRSESTLIYNAMSKNDAINQWSSFSEAISDIKSVTNVKVLWKWFVIFALVLLLLEMLLLKFLK